MWSADALVGLRLLYVYVQRSTGHTYISIWLKDDYPERENCMLKSTKMLSASGGLRPPDPLTKDFALDPTGGTALRPPL